MPSHKAVCISTVLTRLLLLLVGSWVALPLGATGPLPENLNRQNILLYLRDNNINTVEGLIQALPPWHRKNAVLMFKSQAGNAEFVSGEFPRVISFGADARFILSWGTNPNSPGYRSVEFLEPSNERWAAGVIDFRGRVPVLRNPPVCSTCHGSLNKPLWGESGDFPGSEQDVFVQNSSVISLESAAYLQQARESSDPRLAPLEIEALRMLRSRGYALPRKGVDAPDMATEAAMAMQWRHEQVLFRRAAAAGHLDKAARNPAICPNANPSSSLNIPFNLRDTHLSVLAHTGQYLTKHKQTREYCSRVYHCFVPDFHLQVVHDLWRRSSTMQRILRVRTSRAWSNLVDVYRMAYGTHGQQNIDLRQSDPFSAWVDNDDFEPVVNLLKQRGVCAKLQSEGPSALGLLGPPDIGRLEVASFTLVGNDGRKESLGEGLTLEHAGRESVRFNMEVEVTPDTKVQSMRTTLVRTDLRVRHSFVDNFAPFSLFDQANCGTTLPAGDYLLSATPYSQPGARGDAGPSYTIGFEIQSGRTAPAEDEVCPPSQTARGTTDPEIRISGGAVVSEGAPAIFTVAANPRPTEPLSVSVRITQQGDFTSPRTRTVTVPTSGSTELRITTVDDRVTESDGSVTASIVSGRGYTISATEPSATVPVTDNDAAQVVPEVSVAPIRLRATEGETVTFVVAANPPPTEPLSVSVRITQQGDFTSPRTRTVTVPTSGSTELRVTTVDDRVTESDGSVTASIVSGRGYTISAAEPSATVPVADNDAAQVVPEVSVAPIRLRATEGETVTFVVAANPPPTEPLSVSVRITQQGDFTSPRTRTVTVPTSGSTELRVTTVDDRVTESDGSVTASIVSGRGYTISATEPSATVPVTDNDAAQVVPEVSVAPIRLRATEGETVTFVVAANPPPTEPLSVSVRITQQGDFTSPRTRTVTVPTSGSTELRVTTVDDRVTESDGSVTASIVSGRGYTISAAEPSATVPVADNDAAQVVPEVSVAPIRLRATEGETVTFVVAANPPPTEPLSVSVRITQQGDFTSPRTRTVTVQAARRTTGLRVTTVDDRVAESDGSVTASIVPGRGYTISAAEPSATVPVADNDAAQAVPEVSVTQRTLRTTEGETVTFVVTANPPPIEPLSVSVRITQQGDFTSPRTRMVTVPTSGSTELRVTTVDDRVTESDGSVTASIVSGRGYTISAAEPSATVPVADNDIQAREPRVSVIPELESINEGEMAVFTVQADQQLDRDLAVSLGVRVYGDFLVAGQDGASFRTATIRAGRSSTRVVVRTVDDRTDEPDGIVHVYVRRGSGYQSGSPPSAAIEVRDDDT